MQAAIIQRSVNEAGNESLLRFRTAALNIQRAGVRMNALATRRGQTPMALYKLLHRIRQALLDCVQRTLAQEEVA